MPNSVMQPFNFIGVVIGIAAFFASAAAASPPFRQALTSTLGQGTLQRRQFSDSLSSGCLTTGNVSCQNTTTVTDSCCFEAPGGLLLQPQFWDTSPSMGPTDSWTIHGLWPDNCDLTYPSNCDPSRAYSDIRSILTNNGASNVVSSMDTYWVDINGNNDKFWAHEWAKHGTCLSTIQPDCFSSRNETGLDAVAYFQTTVNLFKSLPTYNWLASAGITPSTSATYTLSELTSALQSAAGVIPSLDCRKKVLNGVTWYFNLKGSIIDGEFVPIDAPRTGSCPSSGISYPPK